MSTYPTPWEQIGNLIRTHYTGQAGGALVAEFPLTDAGREQAVLITATVNQLAAQCAELKSRLESAEFWQGTYPEGWTAESVENEMTDFYALMDGIPSLYMHITGGRVSKELTDKSVIKSLHDDYVTELVEEATNELEQQRDELQRLNNLLFQDAYSVYTDACESAGHDPEPMEVWQPKYLRVIDRQAKAKEGV